MEIERIAALFICIVAIFFAASVIGIMKERSDWKKRFELWDKKSTQKK